ncbi:hypothetical protein V1264_016114 [Littorina saxatilis]|uniref:Uncharacterized protein n=1 Tax=Littorina saxatilis TaxID=31220 RepID=A0AAN9BNI0_9CAEN
MELEFKIQTLEMTSRLPAGRIHAHTSHAAADSLLYLPQNNHQDRATLQKQETEIQNLKAAIKQLEDERGDFETKNAVLQRRVTDLEASVKSSKKERQHSSKISLLESELESLRSEREDLRSKCADLERQNAMQTSDLSRLERRGHSAANEASLWKDKLASLSSQVTTLNQSLSNEKAAKEQLRFYLKEKEEQIEELQKEKRSQNRSYATEKELSQSKQQLRKLEITVREQEKQIVERDSKFHQMTKEFTSTQMQSTETICTLIMENKAIIKDLTDKLFHQHVVNSSQQERVTTETLGLLHHMVSGVPNGIHLPKHRQCIGETDEDSDLYHDALESQDNIPFKT